MAGSGLMPWGPGRPGPGGRLEEAKDIAAVDAPLGLGAYQVGEHPGPWASGKIGAQWPLPPCRWIPAGEQLERNRKLF